MADTGKHTIKISNTSSTPNEYLEIYWKVNGTSPETNSSNITFKLQIYSTYSAQARPYSLDAASEKTVSLTINNDRKVYKHNDIWQTPAVLIDFRDTSESNPYVIAEWTGDIQHLNDGSSPAIDIVGVLYFGQESSHPGLTGNHEISYTIPAGEISGVTGRASIPTVTTNSMFGSTVKVDTNPVSPDFRHTITINPYDTPSLNPPLAVFTNVQYTVSFVLAEAWMPPTGSYKQFIVKCETFDGENSLGIEQASFVANVPPSMNTRVTDLVLNISPKSTEGYGCAHSTVSAQCNSYARGTSNHVTNHQWHINAIINGQTYETDFSSGTNRIQDLTQKLRTLTGDSQQDFIWDASYLITVTITDVHGATASAGKRITIRDLSSEMNFPSPSNILTVGDNTSIWEVEFTPRNPDFVHDIYFTFPGYSDLMYVENVSRYVTIWFDVLYADYMPTKAKQRVTVTVYTKDVSWGGAGSIVGVDSFTLYAAIPSTWTPSVRRVYARHISSQTEHPDYNGSIIQGVTSVSVTAYDITAARGTTIDTVRFQGPDIDATRTPESEAGPIDRTQTVNSVSTYGAIKYTVTVKDKRGLIATFESNEITVVEYGSPIIALSAHRCNSEGQRTDFGDHYQADITGSISNLEGTLWAVHLLQREYGDENNPVEVWSLVNQNGPMPSVIESGVIETDPDKAYELFAYIDHYYIPSGETEAVLISRSDIVSMVLSTAKSIIDIYKDKLVTFFGPAEQDVLTNIGEEEAVVFDSPVYGIWNGEHQEIVPVSPIEDLDLVSVTDFDNGKILEVSDGRWSLGEYDKELPSTKDLNKEGTVYILKVEDGRWTSAEKWGYEAIDDIWLKTHIWITPPQPHQIAVDIEVVKRGDNVILRPNVVLSDPTDTITRYRWRGTGIDGYIDSEINPDGTTSFDVTDYMGSGTSTYYVEVSATNCWEAIAYVTVDSPPHTATITNIFVDRIGSSIILRPIVVLSDSDDSIILYSWQGTGITGRKDLRPLPDGSCPFDVTNYVVSGENHYSLTVTAENCLPAYSSVTFTV